MGELAAAFEPLRSFHRAATGRTLLLRTARIELQHWRASAMNAEWPGPEVMLLINNLAGPTIVSMPALAQQAGWLPLFGVQVVVAAFSSACGYMLIEAMRCMPGNHCFEQTIEFTNLASFYLPYEMYVATMVCYHVNSILNLMSLIIQSGQVMDYIMLNVYGCAPGIQLGLGVKYVCGTRKDSATPFGDSLVLSSSMLAVALICAPFAVRNLDDNVILQYLAVIGLSVMSVIWISLLVAEPTFPSPVPVVTTAQSSLIGTVLFNFAFTSALPSWVNEKKSEVSVGATFWTVMVYVVVTYTVIGVIGGMAYPPFYTTDEHLFSKLNAGGSRLGQATVAAYPMLQNVTSIPVLAILIRSNLIQGGLSSVTATFIAVGLPWLMSIPLYTGSGFDTISEIGGLATSSIINFMVPLIMYVVAVGRRKEREELLSQSALAISIFLPAVGLSTRVCAALTGALVRAGAQAPTLLEDAVASRLQPNVRHLGAAMSATSRTSLWTQALGLLHSWHVRRLYADAIVYGIAVNACRKGSAWKEALQVLSDMEAATVQKDVITMNTCLHAMVGAAKWRRALSAFQSMVDLSLADVVSFTEGLVACGTVSRWQQAIALLRQAENMAVKIDARSCNSAMAACDGASCWTIALLLAEDMHRRHLQPTLVAREGVDAVEPCEVENGEVFEAVTRWSAEDCQQATADAFLERVFPYSGAPVLGRPGDDVETKFSVSERQLLGCRGAGFVPWRFGHALICVAPACDTETFVKHIALPMYLETMGAPLGPEDMANMIVQRLSHWRDMKVDFVVAGFERGGTTSIIKFLQAAEDIYMVPFELSDWARDFSTPTAPAPACDAVGSPSYWMLGCFAIFA
ncbi:unnamed protein product [Symbiodinium natans]|uniref:Amino acid transporter transmembrane domain-containing protein n=1 Tax=Symbiodinium natans TaxID=878477 RepID=A0A812P6D2_9DINO|nr:unnamed protein product [Symbiodinium natans]